MAEPRYKADIGGGSLKVPESRIIAGLLLDGVSDEQWRHPYVFGSGHPDDSR